MIEIYGALLSESNDLDIVHDIQEGACTISRSFVSSFRKYVEEVIKSLFGGSIKKTEKIPSGGALYSLDFSELLNEGTADDSSSPEKASAENERLDISVNSRITCKFELVFILSFYHYRDILSDMFCLTHSASLTGFFPHVRCSW